MWNGDQGPGIGDQGKGKREKRLVGRAAG